MAFTAQCNVWNWRHRAWTINLIFTGNACMWCSEKSRVWDLNLKTSYAVIYITDQPSKEHCAKEAASTGRTTLISNFSFVKLWAVFRFFFKQNVKCILNLTIYSYEIRSQFFNYLLHSSDQQKVINILPQATSQSVDPELFDI